MMWGCFTWKGVGYATKIDGTMNGELYREILNDELKKTLEWYELPKESIIFQQDNAPCHTAKVTLEWFKEENLMLMDWPSHSPDLNPIENLWAYLKSKMDKYPHKPTSVAELWQRLEEEWEAIPSDLCERLIESMPDRVRMVIKAKGGHLKK